MSGYREAVVKDGPSFYARLGEAANNALNEIGGTGAQAPPSGTPNGGYSRLQTGPIAHTANKCMGFGGVSGYISFPDNANVDVGDVFTFECWFQRGGGLGTNQTLVAKGTGAYKVRFATDNKIEVLKNGTGSICKSTTAYATAGVGSGFKHLVVTKHGPTGLMKIYVNGVDVTGTVTNQTLTDTATALTLAADNGPSELFNGWLAEVAIYKYAFSQSQARTHYVKGTTAEEFPDLVFEMALESDPWSTTQQWRNYTEYVTKGSTRRGRAEELQNIEAGTAQVTLINTDSRFDPFNTSSPYNGTLKPGRMMRISFDWYGLRYPVFAGYIDGWSPNWNLGPFSDIELQAADGLALINDAAFPPLAAPTLMGTFSNDIPQTFTDGSSFTFPVFGRGLYAVVTKDWTGGEDVSISIKYANQNNNSGDLTWQRLCRFTIPSGARVSDNTKIEAELIPGDFGVCDLLPNTAFGAPQSPGEIKIYSVQETFPLQFTGLRIQAILNAIGWPSTLLNLDSGLEQLNSFSQNEDGSDNPLQRIRDACTAELGDFFISNGGFATFHNRQHRWTGANGAIKATFGDGPGAAELPYVELEPEYDYKRVRNIVTVTIDAAPELDPNKTAHVEDATSIASYGRHAYAVNLITNLWQNGLKMANTLLGWWKNPDQRFNSIKVVPRPKSDTKATATLQSALVLEFGDRIQVIRRPPNSTAQTRTCRVEGISTDFAPRSLSVTFQLSPDKPAPGY